MAKHPHVSLKHYYDRILAVTAKMPKEAAYRVHTEAVVNARRAIVEQVGRQLLNPAFGEILAKC